MKLRNKKTGEIGTLSTNGGSLYMVLDENGVSLGGYHSLAELNEEWEDYGESERTWIIDTMNVCIEDYDVPIDSLFNKQIGNYFKTKEEAEQAVEKLKAWKRLKDKGFKFSGWEIDQKKHLGVITIKTEPYYSFEFEDLDLLFGGEK